MMDLGQGGANDPAVVGGVDAAFGHGLACFQQERLDLRGDSIRLMKRRQFGGGRNVVHNKTRIGRGSEIGGQQINVAFRRLVAV